MPEVERPGKRARYLELDRALDAELQAMADAHGRSFKEEVEHAIRRHLKYPPDMTGPPIPPKDEAPAVAKGRKRKGAGS